MADLATITPPELGRRWRVKPDKILVWIRSGELRAFDVSARPGGRPRFRIPLDAVIEFEQRERRRTKNQKPGRNDPCPCGSGKKYKKCCTLKTHVQGNDTLH